MKPRSASWEAFDRLFAEGRSAVYAGRHRLQASPVEGGSRWGLSALLRPDAASAEVLAEVADEAADVAGGDQWVTGAAACSHLTLRSLEPFRGSIADDDPLVQRYAAALATAVDGIGPLIFAVSGLTLTPHSVMACAIPSDDAADRLANAYGIALGPDGWHEGEFTRDFWYLNLVHFAAAIRDPDQFVGWVSERRDHEIATIVVDEVQLAQWRFTGTGMLPRPVARARMS
jgi:hypothetical protein